MKHHAKAWDSLVLGKILGAPWSSKMLNPSTYSIPTRCASYNSPNCSQSPLCAFDGGCDRVLWTLTSALRLVVVALGGNRKSTTKRGSAKCLGLLEESMGRSVRVEVKLLNPVAIDLSSWDIWEIHAVRLRT